MRHDRKTPSDWLGLKPRLRGDGRWRRDRARPPRISLAAGGRPGAPPSIATKRGLRGDGGQTAGMADDGHVVARCDTSSRESSADAVSEAIGGSLGHCGVLVNAAAVLRPGGLGDAVAGGMERGACCRST